MASIKARSLVANMSGTALGLLVGLGIVVLCLVVVVILLVRASRLHKKLLADMEERGMIITQSQTRDSIRESISKPRAVLRHNTILPFSSKNGWGALSSVESLHPPQRPSIPHYAPPKPQGYVNRPSRLSWPFSARRNSAKALHLKKIRVPVLSTVIESPKPSPLVPVLSGSLDGGPSSPKKSSNSRPTSDQSLLQRHPALRNTWQGCESDNSTTVQLEPLRRSLTTKHSAAPEKRIRPGRANSVAEIPTNKSNEYASRIPRPQLHTRSASMCSQKSGTAPDLPMPPLPLEIACLKTEAKRRSLQNLSPSRYSISSFESAGSSILATQSSPILPRSNNMRVSKVSKRDWRPSLIVGPRPLRETINMHSKNQRSLSSIKSSVARYSVGTPSVWDSKTENRSSTLTNSSQHSEGKVKTAESVTLSKVSSPACSPLTMHSTPRRQSASQVSSTGSPQERRKNSILRSAISNQGGPQRQLSQASTQASSTRSSNGNPFQWDPAPMSAGKPSALKGSPSARKGHRRQNTVRISLAPTILGPPSRSPSPSGMNDIQEESPDLSSTKRDSVGLGFSATRSLPRPPSGAVFAPDVNLGMSNVRSSLTPSSPTLSTSNYDHGPIGSPLNRRWSAQSPMGNRLSTGSVLTLSAFPDPYHFGCGSNMSAPPSFSLSRPSNEYREEMRSPESSVGPSSPFDSFIVDSPFSTKGFACDNEYDPENPQLVYQTPTASPTMYFSLPFSTIPEESSATSIRTRDYRSPSLDSPPCSPKTVRAHAFLPVTPSRLQNASVLSSKTPAIPEETIPETIDPAILSIDTFQGLNSSFSNTNTSLLNSARSSARSSIPIPSSLTSAKQIMDPLIEAAFPSSLPKAAGPSDSPGSSTKRPRSSTHLDVTSKTPPCRTKSPLNLHQPSPGSSTYSSPASSAAAPSPTAPSSPRPKHATLPASTSLALDFTAMPTLQPSPRGPRQSPPRPLSSSIIKLRRMNSDARRESKAERRYLKMGRETSIQLPGEDSWLEDMEEQGDEDAVAGATEVDLDLDMDETWDEEKGKRLLGGVLDDWEEEAMKIEEGDVDTARDKATNTQTNGTYDIKPSNSTAPAKLTQPTITPLEIETTHPIIPSSPPDARSSSIWEDGERFWHSTPPPPSPTTNRPKPKTTSKPSPSPSPTPSLPKKSRKRSFHVAKDSPPLSKLKKSKSPSIESNRLSTGSLTVTPSSQQPGSLSNSRYRKRSVLGIGTPNVSVRIRVQAPSSEVGESVRSVDVGGRGLDGSPGSLYDRDGFLRG